MLWRGLLLDSHSGFSKQRTRKPIGHTCQSQELVFKMQLQSLWVRELLSNAIGRSGVPGEGPPKVKHQSPALISKINLPLKHCLLNRAVVSNICQHLAMALLRRLPPDVSPITRAGQYLSIDSRPMSSARGTLKLILALYKSYLRSSRGTDGGEKIADPFISMNIICPTGSYDTNIEPAKDDVLFTDATVVLAIVEAFLKSVYGELQSSSKVLPASKASIPRPQGFDALLARKLQPPAISSPLLPTPSRSDKNRGLEGDFAVCESSPIAGTVTSRINDSVLGTENTIASIEDGPAVSKYRSITYPSLRFSTILKHVSVAPGLREHCND